MAGNFLKLFLSDNILVLLLLTFMDLLYIHLPNSFFLPKYTINRSRCYYAYNVSMPLKKSLHVLEGIGKMCAESINLLFI